MTEVNGQRRPPQNRSDWDWHREQVRRTNRARQRAEKRLREEKAERWRELYVQEALKEGVTPQPLLKVQKIERDIAKLQAKIDRPDPPGLVGQRFGRLVVIERGPNSPGTPSNRSGERQWVCECFCGKRTLVRASNLKSGNTKSCGGHGRLKKQQDE